MEKYRELTDPMLSHINVGTGVDCTVRELAETIAELAGFRGRIEFDRSKPDGTARKLMHVGKLHQLGWRARIGLREGLRQSYDWFLANEKRARV